MDEDDVVLRPDRARPVVVSTKQPSSWNVVTTALFGSGFAVTVGSVDEVP